MLAAGPAVSTVSGWLYVATGLAVLVSTALPSGAADRDLLVVRLVNASAVLAGIVMLLARGRLGRWLPYLVTYGGVLLITTALLGSGGGVSAVAYGCVYCLAPGYSFLMLPRRPATVLLVLTVATGAPALATRTGVGPAEQVVVWSVAVLLAAVIGWMARALAQAEADTLTGLLNRRGMERAMQEAIASSGEGGRLAHVVVNIDHFKAYNETQGRASGDRLLLEVASAWQSLLPTGAALGRLGADEFGVLLPGCSLEDAGELAQALHRAVPAGVTLSAGVAAREPGESASTLLARTDSAVYTAKREGRARTHLHPGAGRDGQRIRDALEGRQFVVHFQPIVELASGRTVGAEALVRWQHPELGLLAPGHFLAEAERSGVIVQLGAWVLQEACRVAAGWSAVAGVLPYVTVNASGEELQSPGYSSMVADALRDSGLPAARLVLELVESDYDIESLHLANNLHHLTMLGVRTAMDDFGVGHSSLDRLRRSGVDTLKIDRSFIAAVETCQGGSLVTAIIAMARALRLRVVAEGVETEQQAQWLTAAGCDYAQGWFYGRPAPALPAQEHDGVLTVSDTPVGPRRV